MEDSPFMFSGTSDETNVTLFSSSSPVQMHRKTNDQTGSGQEVRRFVPYASRSLDELARTPRLRHKSTDVQQRCQRARFVSVEEVSLFLPLWPPGLWRHVPMNATRSLSHRQSRLR